MSNSSSNPRPEIADPWHSRSFKTHRFTRNPDWFGLLRDVWEHCCGDLDRPGRPGPAPATSAVTQLNVLLTDLYQAHRHDPSLSLGLPMSESAWKVSSRYNPMSLSRTVPRVVHRLHRTGMLHLSPGSYGGRDARGNRTTRIRPAQPLRDRFSRIEVRDTDIVEVPRESILMKDGDGNLLDYDDTPATLAMRANLRAYNGLIAVNRIELDGLEEPFITRVKQSGEVVRVPIDRDHQFTRRIFSRGDWDCNGRFYGPWWQQVDSATRSRILINGRRTVEVDFKSMHPALLAASQGLDLTGDLYHLPPGTLSWASPEEQRRLVKQLVLMALNARTRQDAYASFRNNQPRGTRAKAMTNAELEALLDRFVFAYPWIDLFLGADVGIRLMNTDARIAGLVIDHFTSQSGAIAESW